MAAVLVVAAGSLLAVGSFLGQYVRPTSDDWCACWKTRDLGIFGFAQDFYRNVNGRVGNALLNGLVYSHGTFGPKLLPGLLVVLLTAGLVLLGRSVLGPPFLPAGRKPPLTALTAAVLVVEALLFYAGTRTYQVLLWAPGTISHLVPCVLTVWAVLAALLAWRRGGGGRRVWRGAAVGSALLIGVLIGTLSEPFSAVSGLIAVVAALGFLAGLRSGTGFSGVARMGSGPGRISEPSAGRTGRWASGARYERGPEGRRRDAHHPRRPLRPALKRAWKLALGEGFPFAWCVAWSAGLVIGTTLLFTSPGATQRRNGVPRTAPPLSPSELRATVHDWLRVAETVTDSRAYLGAFAVGALLGLAAVAPRTWYGAGAAGGHADADGGGGGSSAAGVGSAARGTSATGVGSAQGAGCAGGAGSAAGGAGRSGWAGQSGVRGSVGAVGPGGSVVVGVPGRPGAGVPGGAATECRCALLRSAVLLALPVFLLGLCSFAVVFALRLGIGPAGWAVARTWTPFMLPSLILLCLYGVLAGRLLGQRLADGRRPLPGRCRTAVRDFPTSPSPPSRRSLLSPQSFKASRPFQTSPSVSPFTSVSRTAVAAALAGVCALGALVGILPEVRALTTETVVRADLWDQQDAVIRAQIAQGASVVAYRPLRIGALAEPRYPKDPGKDWVADCIRRYYGLTRIQPPR